MASKIKTYLEDRAPLGVAAAVAVVLTLCASHVAVAYFIS